MTKAVEDEVARGLQEVCDPCSIAANAPLSIVDMGLVKGWSVDGDGNVVVRMCLTSPMCTMVPHMVKGVEEVLAGIEGIAAVRVEIDPTIRWSPHDMTFSGRVELERRRRESLERSPVRPQQWREQAEQPPVGAT